VSAVEVVLRYDDDRWHAHGGGVTLEHVELRALDRLLMDAFHDRPCVHVRFDLGALPVWLRQYQAHYCNYTLRIARGAAP
jgi:Family of unknown function (DUF5395)